MERKAKRALLSTLLAFIFSCAPAHAGDLKIEADRCLRWLDAFAHGQIDQAAIIGAEQIRPEDVPQIYINAQRNNLTELYNKILKIGSGNPKVSQFLDDVIAPETGDIIKRQMWEFGPNIRAYVGCASYPGTDSPWHLVVKFEDDLTALTVKMEVAAKSRLASQPDR